MDRRGAIPPEPLDVLRVTRKVDVALYRFAVRRFGARREFAAWRPELSLDQWRERRSSPGWAPPVTTVEGRVLLKPSEKGK
ncbi:MAG TPA: hypothetical protein VGZ29_06905 [Terriglobia bacterium]|nr:hypothetical protein [Terriglobia bacterium]